MKIAYDGSSFHGHARQPGLRTVEGEVLRALVGARLVRDARTSRFQSASRTDRGVSALGNVVAFDAPLAPEASARAFNAKADGVWGWAAASVPSDFDARRVRERWYRYYVPPHHDPKGLRPILRRFVGEHDFRNFTRERSRTILRIDAATARREGRAVILDVRAPSFRWNLVRRIVAATLRVACGDVPAEDLQRALRADTRVDFGLAPPEPLVLMDVRYDVPLFPVRDPTTRLRIQRALQAQDRAIGLLRGIRDRFAMNP